MRRGATHLAFSLAGFLALGGCQHDGGQGTGGLGGSDGEGGGGDAPGAVKPRSCPAPAAMPCTAAGWCNEYPGLPLAITAASAWAPDDAWMAAPGGHLIHADCNHWSIAETIEDDIELVQVAGPDDVWLLGSNGSLWHRKAGVLMRVREGSPSKQHAWNVSAPIGGGQFLVAPYDSGLIRRWTGSDFEDLPASTGGWVNFLRVTAPDDVWAVADSRPFHYDGISFRRVPDPAVSMGGVWSVAAGGPRDVWLGLPEDGKVAHFDGGAFQVSEAPSPDFYRLTDNGVGQVFLDGETGMMRRADGQWVPALDERGQVVRGRYEGSGPAAGDFLPSARGFAHWNGDALERIEGGAALYDDAWDAVTSVWQASATELWAVPVRSVDHPNEFLRYTGAAGWEHQALQGQFNVVAGSAPDNVWVAGTRAWHFEGKKFSEAPLPPGEEILSLWTGSPDEAWATHNGSGLLHFKNGAWSVVKANGDIGIASVWGSGKGDVWALSHQWEAPQWEVLRSDGGGPFVKVPRPAVMDEGDVRLFGVLRDEVWLAVSVSWGEFGGTRLFRYRAEKGEFVPVNVVNKENEPALTSDASGIAGDAPDNVWVFGLGLYHFDGVQLTEVEGDIERWVTAASRALDGTWWFTGSERMYHWDGKRLIAERIPAEDSFHSLFAEKGAPIAVGFGGTVVRRGPRP